LTKPYTVFPLDDKDPSVKEDLQAQFCPALKVQLGNIATRQRAPKFDAIVDSGSPWCIFKIDMARFIGLDLNGCPSYPLGGVIQGPRETMYFHKVNIFVEKYWCIEVLAAFCDNLGTTGLLGRFGFFNNFIVNFDHSGKTPQLHIEKINRA
jgi:hypothetical protein